MLGEIADTQKELESARTEVTKAQIKVAITLAKSLVVILDNDEAVEAFVATLSEYLPDRYTITENMGDGTTRSVRMVGG